MPGAASAPKRLTVRRDAGRVLGSDRPRRRDVATDGCSSPQPICSGVCVTAAVTTCWGKPSSAPALPPAAPLTDPVSAIKPGTTDARRGKTAAR